MKECAIDRERTVVSHDQASEVSQPSVGALHYPSPSVTPQGSTVLRRRPNAVLFVRADELDPATLQTLSQRIAVVRFVGDHPHRLLPSSAEADAGDRRQSVRQRSVAKAFAASRDRAHLPAQKEPRSAGDAGRSSPEALQKAMDSGAHQRLAGKLPTLGRAIRPFAHDLWRILSYRLLYDRSTKGCAIASRWTDRNACPTTAGGIPHLQVKIQPGHVKRNFCKYQGLRGMLSSAASCSASNGLHAK